MASGTLGKLWNRMQCCRHGAVLSRLPHLSGCRSGACRAGRHRTLSLLPGRQQALVQAAHCILRVRLPRPALRQLLLQLLDPEAAGETWGGWLGC